ncbi:hypothetical protein [Lapillicoccus jejuensis]|uniref:Uncharacterized protein n=1 Tax=Lapillicoccus jejuensis TaxID=402171 RepID=A0A542E6U4_9MICO|nr:hypothetical protein [Lapillicoccus jejuensis]TQJ10976.1 hypothetical protein FB458_4120 [Lapillicoccus jejuensis]
MSDADDQAHPEPLDEGEDGLFPAPFRPAPRTGDEPVDEALGELEQAARDGDLDAQARAGERVHARLQERLQDLGRG